MSDIKTVIKNAPDSGERDRRLFCPTSIKKRSSRLAAFAKNGGCSEQDYAQSGFNFSRQKMKGDYSIS
ncbi:hypothetical protein [Acinetobacter sp. TSRC1-2]|uniref:hypothetical protein n=1 Tax=unclassified Acinetobacter TaxID=196816 RepID=UPI003CF74B53